MQGEKDYSRVHGCMGELVEGWQEMNAKKKLALVMDCACTDGRMGRAIQKMWSS